MPNIVIEKLSFIFKITETKHVFINKGRGVVP